MSKIKELKEKRASLVKQMNDINDKATEENRSLSKEENDTWDKVDNDVIQLDTEIRQAERLVELNKEASRRIDPLNNENPEERKKTPEEIEKRSQEVFAKWALWGGLSLDQEERSILKEMRAKESKKEEERQSTTPGEGGYTIPTGFANEIEKAMLSFGGMMEVSRIIKTVSGNTIDFPEVNDSTNKGRLLGEKGNAASGTTPIVFTNKQFLSYKFTSDFLPFTQELLDDSFFNFPGLMNDFLTERVARIANQYFTVGTGSSQPLGAATAASLGVTAVANTAITGDEIIDLIHSVNSAYRKNGRLMFNDNTLKVLKKLKDGDGNYLWVTSLRDGEPNSLAGKPYTINDDMADIGASTRSVLFGDFQKFRIRQVGNPYLKRSEHIYVETDQIGMGLFARYDSKLVDGGGGAIKHLVHPA